MKIGNPVRAYVVEPLEEPAATEPADEKDENSAGEAQAAPTRTELEKAPAA